MTPASHTFSPSATILQVSTADVAGGAEKVAADLHHEYRARGLDAWLAVGKNAGTDPHTVAIPNDTARNAWTRALGDAGQRLDARGGLPAKLASRAALFASDPDRYRRMWTGHEDFGYAGTKHLLELTPTPPSIVHLHNLHGWYFDLRELPSISAKVPTILTLHDPWLLTGHCAHPFDCPKWRTGCGACPDLDMYLPISRDASAANFQLKRDLLARSRVGLATPSRWLLGMLEDAGLDTAALGVRLIRNGVDTTVFSAGDKLAARSALGLPADHDLLLVSGNVVSANPFKDFATLQAALPALAAGRENPPVLINVGEASAERRMLEGIEVIGVPFQRDPAMMAQLYRAADVYVHPARAENLPLAIIEAMACGTPVVASAVGGVPEIVADGLAGTLVPVGDSEAMSAAILELLGDEGRRATYSMAGLARVAEKFTLRRQADAYLDWYAELTER